MARASMLVLIAGCLVVAAVCVQAAKYEFEFYEHMVDESNMEPVFKSKNSTANDKSGEGYVYEHIATKTADPKSEAYATVSGMYFYTTDDTTQEVFVIETKDVDALGEMFANGELHIRGVWNLVKGDDAQSQELSIVGGSYGLANAYGTLKYSRQGKSNTWYVKATFLVDC